MPSSSRMTTIATPTVAFALLVGTSYSLLTEPRPGQSAMRVGNVESGVLEDAGIPVTSDLVIAHCSACHVRDDDGMMSRISYVRKAPEGWQTSIRRMVMLNGVSLEPDVAREIVRYLSNSHGLAPEELRPGMFEVERRMIDHRYEADEETETTCKQCHSLGRVIIQRRTRDEWGLLLATHRGLYPDVDFQAFRRGGPPPDDAEDTRHPMDKAVAHLSDVFPLETPEWSAWSATMRPARLAGTWALMASDPAAGPIYGTMEITANAGSDDEFTTRTSYTPAGQAQSVSRTGRALVYTGFQWRGRSFESGDQEGLREVMFVERDWRTMSGRWFTGAYDEFGLDVTLRRVGSDPVVLGVHPSSIRNDGAMHELRIYGANLPSSLDAGAVDFGPGITVNRIVSASSEVTTIQVTTSADADIGARDLYLAGANQQRALVVYDEIDRIEVTPRAGMARIGGANLPKGYQQFAVNAFHDGADGERGTDDDLDLGRVDVTWQLEEYDVTFEDDDTEYVGTLDQHGLFTPALDGPNPDRRGNRNNIGDVWVVATHTPPSGGPALRGRAHLLVTVPLYIRFEPWRAEQ